MSEREPTNAELAQAIRACLSIGQDVSSYASGEWCLDILLSRLAAAELRHCGWKEGDGPCRLGRDNLCEFCEMAMERDALRAEIATLRARLEQQDGPCWYCGEPTESLAGCPSRWPLHFPHSDEPGVIKPHHTGCVMDRLLRLERWEWGGEVRDFRQVKVGDKVTRLLAGTIPQQLVVTDVTAERIVCGDWEFSRLGGYEIDEVLGWGEELTGSFLAPPEEETA